MVWKKERMARAYDEERSKLELDVLPQTEERPNILENIQLPPSLQGPNTSADAELMYAENRDTEITNQPHEESKVLTLSEEHTLTEEVDLADMGVHVIKTSPVRPEPMEEDNEEHVEPSTDQQPARSDAVDDLINTFNTINWEQHTFPEKELNHIMDAVVRKCKEGFDDESDHKKVFKNLLKKLCITLFENGIIYSWNHHVYKKIELVAMKTIEACVADISHVWVLDVLGILLNPSSVFHANIIMHWSTNFPESRFEPYARKLKTTEIGHTLEVLINYFGSLGGFRHFTDNYSCPIAFSLILLGRFLKIFSRCKEFLTHATVMEYFVPLVDYFSGYLDNLGEQQKKKIIEKQDIFTTAINDIKNVTDCNLPYQVEIDDNLRLLKLKLFLRYLELSSSFNGRVVYLTSFNSFTEICTATNIDEICEWIKEHDILSIVLRDDLHHTDFVEKLECLLSHLISTENFTTQDLDRLWDAQLGKHDVIVENVHSLLVKLVGRFSSELVLHLFECFKRSLTTTNTMQMKMTLKFVKDLSEHNGRHKLAHKSLMWLWSLARSEDVSSEVREEVLATHFEILRDIFNENQMQSDEMVSDWIDRFVEELKTGKWILSAMRQIEKIWSLYPKNSFSRNQSRRTAITRLQGSHSIITFISENLSNYMTAARQHRKRFTDNPDLDPGSGEKDDHIVQVEGRLHFLKFLLKMGQMCLDAPVIKQIFTDLLSQIWEILVVNAVFDTDKDAAFNWLTLLAVEVEMDANMVRDFFQKHFLQLDASLLSEDGSGCFAEYFKKVNLNDRKLLKCDHHYETNDMNLIGLENLWQVALRAQFEIACPAIRLLTNTYSVVANSLQPHKLDICKDFIKRCFVEFRKSYDIDTVLKENGAIAELPLEDTKHMIRVLQVLNMYVMLGNNTFTPWRATVPLARAFQGDVITLKISCPGYHQGEFEILSHKNETFGAVRRHIFRRMSRDNFKWKFYITEADIDIEINFCNTPICEFLSKSNRLDVRELEGDRLCCLEDSNSPNPEMEKCLPGVVLAQEFLYVRFLMILSHVGEAMDIPDLWRNAIDVLFLIPAAKHTVGSLRSACSAEERKNCAISPRLESMFFNSIPTEILYNLTVCYSLLMPSTDPFSNEAFNFQCDFVLSGGIQLALRMLTDDSFLVKSASKSSMSAMLTVLRICKLMLTILAMAKVHIVLEACTDTSKSHGLSERIHQQTASLQQALQYIPDLETDCILRTVASRVGTHLAQQITDVTPDLTAVEFLLKLAWMACRFDYICHFRGLPVEYFQIESIQMKTGQALPIQNIEVAKGAIETLSICLALSPDNIEILHTGTLNWFDFVVDLVLKSDASRTIRQCAGDMFFLIAARCSTSNKPTLLLIEHLLSVCRTKVNDYGRLSSSFFHLLSRLLAFASAAGLALPCAKNQMEYQIKWLDDLRMETLKAGQCQVHETLVKGHLRIAAHLLPFMDDEQKKEFNLQQGGNKLIRQLVEDFAFPASQIISKYHDCRKMCPATPIVSICSSPDTMEAVYDLLVALCTGCFENLKFLCVWLMHMHNTVLKQLTVWEYRPKKELSGFVGLKNGGATCYMNSILQQVFMVEPLRNGILSLEGAADVIGEEQLEDHETKTVRIDSEEEYNAEILKQLQIMFYHLAFRKLDFFVPNGFWKYCKVQDRPVELGEQQDALEFFNSLASSIDGALKSRNQPKLFEKYFEGSFDDQKICKDCPHRYHKEEAFTALNLDISGNENLFVSLERFVESDLLEGNNAYHCEKCNKKVDTEKRLVIQKLPSILIIQLKRFQFDLQTFGAKKINDYCEFPEELDMEPYTIYGLAKKEGEVIDESLQKDKPSSMMYRLKGVVIHSGNANSGHYYSYIRHRESKDAKPKWYKFDDQNVAEFNLDIKQVMEDECFGGPNGNEIRWWSAYILFYERIDDKADNIGQKSKPDSPETVSADTMPLSMRRMVQWENSLFACSARIYTSEYFSFIRSLIRSNEYICKRSDILRLKPVTVKKSHEEASLRSLDLAIQVIFVFGLRTDRAISGNPTKWYDAIKAHLQTSANVRGKIANWLFLENKFHLTQYLRKCPIKEVRLTYAKILAYVAHLCTQDGPCRRYTKNMNLVDTEADLGYNVLSVALEFLPKHITKDDLWVEQYFAVFNMYAQYGIEEKKNLLRLNVPKLLMPLVLKEGLGLPVENEDRQFDSLFSVVAQLIPCCDVSHHCFTHDNSQTPTANPYIDSKCSRLVTLDKNIDKLLFSDDLFIKKLIQDNKNIGDNIRLIQYCSWENSHFSDSVLHYLLWQVAYSYTHRLHSFLEPLFHLLMIEDSLQETRLSSALKKNNCLFIIIQDSKIHYPNRAYQCIEMLTRLFTQCSAAANILKTVGEIKRKFTWSVHWLNEHLESERKLSEDDMKAPPAFREQFRFTSCCSQPIKSSNVMKTLEMATELCFDKNQDKMETDIKIKEENDEIWSIESTSETDNTPRPAISNQLETGDSDADSPFQPQPGSGSLLFPRQMSEDQDSTDNTPRSAVSYQLETGDADADPLFQPLLVPGLQDMSEDSDNENMMGMMTDRST